MLMSSEKFSPESPLHAMLSPISTKNSSSDSLPGTSTVSVNAFIFCPNYLGTASASVKIAANTSKLSVTHSNSPLRVAILADTCNLNSSNNGNALLQLNFSNAVKHQKK